jgi:hypothetical protein
VTIDSIIVKFREVRKYGMSLMATYMNRKLLTG